MASQKAERDARYAGRPCRKWRHGVEQMRHAREPLADGAGHLVFARFAVPGGYADSVRAQCPDEPGGNAFGGERDH